MRRRLCSAFVCVGTLAMLFACGHSSERKEPVVDTDSGATAPAVDASALTDASDSGPVDAAVLDATQFADGGYAILEKFAGKKILHCGDSMVGGAQGLTAALAPRFRGSGAKYVHDTQVSLFMRDVAHGDYLSKLIARHNPDVVIITLGANDVLMPHPEYLVNTIEAIARKTKGRACYWTAPPLWKADTGVLKVLEEHAAPCKVFDVNTRTDLKIPRRNDGIHPSDEGGEMWAEAFWEFLATEPLTAPSSDSAPDSGASPLFDLDASTDASR